MTARNNVEAILALFFPLIIVDVAVKSRLLEPSRERAAVALVQEQDSAPAVTKPSLPTEGTKWFQALRMLQPLALQTTLT